MSGTSRTSSRPATATGDVIRATAGAGTQAATTFDGRGLPLKVVRPNGRGFTLYAYDLDGALLREATRTATAELWETAYVYDNTGRVATVSYADSTTEVLTYNPDSTVRTRQTRDGLLVTFDYDVANRLKKAIPTATGTATTLLDAGDALDYDKLSRPTLLQRGHAGTAGYDAALSVSYPSYDLASLPAAAAGCRSGGGMGAAVQPPGRDDPALRSGPQRSRTVPGLRPPLRHARLPGWPDPIVAHRAKDLHWQQQEPVVMTCQPRRLVCSGLTVASLMDAFSSDLTWYARFRLDLDQPQTDLGRRVLEFVELSEDWNERVVRNPGNPPDPAEFAVFSDLIDSNCWTAECEDGRLLRIAEAPVFLKEGELSWRFMEE